VTRDLAQQGYDLISEVDHAIARMGFFNTYHVLGVATGIMGVKPEGWAAIEQMRRAK
jgi:methylmalonyl-CoA/ethylmalonyl-CoA epimerase